MYEPCSSASFIRSPGRRASRPAAQRTVVHILSTNYCGSHYLSLMLGSHSQARHLGEVHRLRHADRRHGERLCFACRHRERCSLFGDIEPEQADQVFHRVFARVDPRVTTLIDNSKMADGWVDRFVEDGCYRHKFIHLIRDPRALVRRWSLAGWNWRKRWRRRLSAMAAFPARAAHLAIAPFSDVLTYHWLQQNYRITRLIQQHGLDAWLVTYHDLALEPAAELGELVPWLDLPFEPEQCEYWKFEHHGTQKVRYQWINEFPNRYFDLRWQKDLPAEVQQQVIDNPEVRNYLESLRVVAGDDGLVRTEALARSISLPGRIRPTYGST